MNSITVKDFEGKEFGLDFADALEAERRLPDLGICNAQTGQYLFPVFGRAYLSLSNALAKLEYEEDRAEAECKRIRSTVVLEDAKARLEAKGLISPRAPAGSEDFRDACVNSDPRYTAALEAKRVLTYWGDIVRRKMMAMAMHYSALKTVTDATKTVVGRSNPRLSTSGIDEDDIRDMLAPPSIDVPAAPVQDAPVTPNPWSSKARELLGDPKY